MSASRRGHLDRARDDLVAELSHLLDDVERQQGASARVADEADAVFFQTELVDAARELLRYDFFHDLDDRVIDPLDHAGLDAARRHGVLIAIDTDRAQPALARRREHAVAGLARRREDDVGALLVLRRAELLAERRIRERLWLGARVRRQHAARRTHVVNTGLVARLELAEQRNLHAADKPDRVRARRQPCDRADQERTLVLAKPQPREVRELRRARAGRVVDARKLHVGELLGQLLEVRPEDEPDADHEVDMTRRERAQRALASVALGRLDELDVHPELVVRAQEAAVRRGVERLVVLTADVEHQADVHASAELFRLRRDEHPAGGDQQHVDRDEPEEQPAWREHLAGYRRNRSRRLADSRKKAFGGLRFGAIVVTLSDRLTGGLAWES